MNTLGEFKLHPSATQLKPKRQYRSTAGLLEAVYQAIKTHPRATKQDVSIYCDVSESRASQLLPMLEKQGRVFKVTNMPARYRAHEPVNVVKLPEPRGVLHNLDIVKKHSCKPFEVELDEWFLHYANSGQAGDLNEINKLRLYVKSKGETE